MSFDFIPLELYTVLYYYSLLILILVTFFKLQKGFQPDTAGGLLVLLIIIYMGFRPVSSRYFLDMGTYATQFRFYQQGHIITSDRDMLFQFFMKGSSYIMSENFFFFCCAILYIYPLYLVSKKWFKNYWFYSFLFLIASFSFWGYGVNGIRNGIAGSFFLLAISKDKRLWQAVLLFVAISFHKAMLLPTLGFVIAQFYNKPKQMILFWMLCIPLSIIGGGFWEVLFSGLGFEDDRLSYLTTGDANASEFASTGFRWDFLAYSATAVYAGWYFIVKKKFNDKIYFALFNTYVFANAFWILVIRANFSNRFAYLSWFMIAIIIVYPFLKANFFQNQSKVFAKILLAYFMFTYIMNVLLFKG